MSVKPFDFLNSAQELAVGTNEMSIRNAISRAYYAAFHHSNEVIASEKTDEKTGMHRRYINQLIEGEMGSAERAAGLKLKTIYGRRLKADYQLDMDMSSYDVAMQISNTREIFKLLKVPQAEEKTK